MATGIVPYEKKQRVFTIMCEKCGCMYIPERGKDRIFKDGTLAYFEACPECGYECNDISTAISQMKYKFIRFFRSLAKTNKMPFKLTDEVECVINMKDYKLDETYARWLKTEVKERTNGEMLPYLIIKTDIGTLKRGEIISRDRTNKSEKWGYVQKNTQYE